MTERPDDRPVRRSLSRRSACKALGAGVLAGAGAGGVLAQQPFPPPESTDWGPPAPVGEGVAAAFVTPGGNRPRYVGAWFTAGALSGVPTDEHSKTVLALPDTATESGAPFHWVGMDWNPEGHAPADVYDVPHFDFHFYLQEREQVVEAIPAGECDRDGDGTPDAEVPCDVYERAVEPVPDAQRPPGFVSTEDVVPVMGNHLVDEDAPEFEGEPFTHTMVWGSFDGRLVFAEPMVAVDYLESLESSVAAPTSLPDVGPEAGFYPSRYSVRYRPDQDAYAVTLEGFRRLPGATS